MCKFIEQIFMKQKGQIPTDTTIVPNIIVETAIAEVGYTENPPNSNRTKYGEWFGFDGVPGVVCLLAGYMLRQAILWET